ncbi:MAG: ATP-dependent DNA helicase sgs1 [Tremellales sp. Tagirdzhanova-0007]|nr:MAG: ATP-dependent DNA helicase sgs1 [Tremellales sp. Tagirdzhanova-0007]
MLNAIGLNGGEKLVLVVAVTKAMQDDQTSLPVSEVYWQDDEVQVDSLRRMGFLAYALNEDTCKHDESLYTKFRSGHGHFFTMSPEKLRNDKRIRETITTIDWRSKCAAAYMDEAHTVEEWGRSFRPDIMSMWEVCEGMGSHVPWAFLSASVGVRQLKTLVDVFRLNGRIIKGLDVGCERDELYFDVRPFANDPLSFADLSTILPS